MSDTGDRPSTDGTREQSPSGVARQTPAPLFAPGDRLPNLEMWVLERKLGGGGFGEGWLARHERKGEAAVKFCTDPAARHTLVTHERAVVARVMRYGGNHSNIVPLLECNLSGAIPWLMYEYVEGGTLVEAVEEWRALPPPRRLGRAVKELHALAGALGTFHRFDPPLVHRDLKPQNVLMSHGTPRITDFGIGGVATAAASRGSDPEDIGTAMHVRVPTIIRSMGSSRYAPQEQFLGSPPSPRDDVYALGVIAYQLVRADLKTAPGPDAATELRALKMPVELTSLIARSVELDPDRRPKDASEWEQKLSALMQRKTVAASAPPPPPDDEASDATEPLQPLNESCSVSYVAPQTIELEAKGRWYSRAATAGSKWQIVAATPAAVLIAPGEVYRFSIHSAATEDEVDGISALSGLKTLYYLNLSYCAGVTDAALLHLEHLPGLRQLFLRGCAHITDAGLEHLHGLDALRQLELTDCPQLSDAAIAELQSALPKCKIAV
jgi:serine/threonine protein kinase